MDKLARERLERYGLSYTRRNSLHAFPPTPRPVEGRPLVHTGRPPSPRPDPRQRVDSLELARARLELDSLARARLELVGLSYNAHQGFPSPPRAVRGSPPPRNSRSPSPQADPQPSRPQAGRHGVPAELDPRALEAQKRIEQLTAELERTGVCVICQDGEAIMAVVDCGHLSMCRECSAQVMKNSRECPLCRKRIVSEKRLIRIFKS